MISKFKTPKAIKSKQVIEKGLAKLGESLGLGKPFFAAITFSEKEGVWKVCPCCGGQSILKGFI